MYARTHPDFKTLAICDHPLVQDRLTRMRDKSCAKTGFSDGLRQIARLMTCEMTADLAVSRRRIETPLAPMDAPCLADPLPPVIVPILRAGLGMAAGVEDILPEAAIGHIGLYREHDTLEIVEYLVRLPNTLQDRRIFMVDPMLATGQSSAHCVEVLLAHGAQIRNIFFMCLVAAPEGVKAFTSRFPEIRIYTAALDSHLNEKAYIVPGLGDAGDRLYDTL